MKVIVTGGAGFIGSNLIRHIINNTEASVINIDKLTYASNLNSLKDISKNSRYKFKKACITDKKAIQDIIFEEKPDAIMNLAAESHVDRSIDNPNIFLETNILGTYNLLDCWLQYYKVASKDSNKRFIFHHISTDEVYGDLESNDPPFTELSRYDPSSPYSASKASSDHLVRSWSRTFGLPILLTNCSNNYGPYHFPEKLIPHTIISALELQNIPIFGDGSQRRDWLFVEDHADALWTVLKEGKINETYNIGGGYEMTNLNVVKKICTYLDRAKPIVSKEFKSYHELISFVDDRPGHDFRYAINYSKIKDELGWAPKKTFNDGLGLTIEWYLNNEAWWREILDSHYELKRLGKSDETL